MSYDFSILKTAGVTPGITAKIVGVSRVTASQWCNGRRRPHHLLAARVEEYLTIVHLAVDKGLLPLKDYPGRRNIAPEISKALLQAKLAQTAV